MIRKRFLLFFFLAFVGLGTFSLLGHAVSPSASSGLKGASSPSVSSGLEEASSSERPSQATALSSSIPKTPYSTSAPPLIKMSGTIQRVEATDSGHRLILIGENGQEKSALLSKDTPVILQTDPKEKIPLQIERLKTGDVVDLDVERDEATGTSIARRVSVVVRTSAKLTPEEKALLKDPTFQ